MLISNVLFECDSVSAFKIPPGPVSLLNWTTRQLVWKGSIRLLEEEQTSASAELASYLGLRLKLELFNKNALDAVLAHFQISGNRLSWAEVWYNPFLDTKLDYKIANDGSDSISMTPESPKYYRIVSQLPDTGYSPLPSPEKGFLLQVALGLQFDDLFSASSFSESLAIYKRHFRNFQDKFLYDQKLASLDHTLVTSLALSSTDTDASQADDNDDEDDDDDDNDFGNFVESSYD